MQPDFRAFFESYVDAYNRSLGERVDVAGIRKHFADSFIAAGPQGVVTGDNDESFIETLKKGYAFYRAIGTRHLDIHEIDAISIDGMHYQATVSYRARYHKPDAEVTIPFDVTYMLEWRDNQLKIFGYVSCDEMALYRKYGIIHDAAE
jgi:hypothetical protein